MMESLSRRQAGQLQRQRRERALRGLNPLPNGPERRDILSRERNARRRQLRNANRDRSRNGENATTVNNLDDWRNITPTLHLTENEPGPILDRAKSIRQWPTRNNEELKSATVAILHLVILCFGSFYVRPYFRSVACIPNYSQNVVWLVAFLKHCQTGIPLQQTFLYASNFNWNSAFKMYIPLEDNRICGNDILYTVNPNVDASLYSEYVSQIIKTLSTLPAAFIKYIPLLYKTFSADELQALHTVPYDLNKFCTEIALENLKSTFRYDIICFACAKSFSTNEEGVNHVKHAHKAKFCGPIHCETIDARTERRVRDAVQTALRNVNIQ